MAAATPATGATPAPYASASLYVGDLNNDVSEAALFEIFNAVGPVASVRVCRDAATRRSLGYAYVNFHRVEDAERALDTMNFSPIRGRACRIMWSHRDPSLRKSGFGNIFIKNLDKTIDNKTLYDTFSVFGNILSCKVCTNQRRESLGYGFVHFESDEAAANAIARCNGMQIAGKTVSVAQFKSKRERGGNEKHNFTNIYVNNLPVGITADKVDEAFKKFGNVTSSWVSPVDEKGRGQFGFVNFETPEQAQAAVEGLNGQDPFNSGKKVLVTRAQKKEERERELREHFEQLKMERIKKFANVNLYIKNLSDDVDEDRLRAEFSKFGNINSCKVMRENGKSKGFGFVCFTAPEEATKAVTEMNGKMFDGKPLFVAVAQRKEMRRAALEAQHAQRAKLQGIPPAMFQAPGAPMYFAAGPQGMGPQRMLYPQQQMMQQRRWPQGQAPPQGGPQVQPRPQPMIGQPGVGYMPVQAVNGGHPRGGGVPRNAGGRGGQRLKPGQQAGGPMYNAAGAPGGRQGRGQPQPPNYGGKNLGNMRNGQNPALAGGQPNGMGAPVVPGGPQQPLTIQALAAAPEELQKQMIGERLFPLIQDVQPELAGKITGMLLEMDNGELLHLIESQEARIEKINEAMTVLQHHDDDDDAPKDEEGNKN